MEKFIKNISMKTWTDLEERTIEAGKKVLIDTIGAMMAGAKEDSTQNLMKQFYANHQGECLVIGTDVRFDLHTAALINGVATVAVELDEGNQWSKGHPAAHVIPTMLTYVQTKEAYSGKELLLHLIKSYEICSYFGRATTLLPMAHAHGTWGVTGAAASALFLEGCTPEELYEGLNISASFAMPTMWNAALEGALIRNIYVGQAAETGIKTVTLLKSNFLAPKNNLSYVFEKVIGNHFDCDSFAESKNNWDIEKNYFKTHAFCRYTHAPLDAFQKIVIKHAIEPEAIEKIDVRTYSRAATLNSSDYHNELSAKFSIPYALASWLYTKKSDHAVFEEKYLKSSQILELAKKVNVSASIELEKNYPTVMPAEVEVKLKTDDIFKERLDQANTGLGENVTFNQLEEKFKANTEHLPTVQQERIVDWIKQMEDQEDVGELLSLLKTSHYAPR